MNNQPVYCPECHQTVAKFDPERVQVELSVYHRHCLKQKNNRLNCHIGYTSHRQPCSCNSCIGQRLNAM